MTRLQALTCLTGTREKMKVTKQGSLSKEAGEVPSSRMTPTCFSKRMAGGPPPQHPKYL